MNKLCMCAHAQTCAYVCMPPCMVPLCQCLKCHRVVSACITLRTMATGFRFVHEVGDHGFKWKVHRRTSGIFPTAEAAADDLSRRLGVKTRHLKKSFQGDVPKPQLTPSLEAISGLFWHPRKLGWFSKKHRQYHFSPRAST